MKYTHGGDIYSYDGRVTDFSANINPLGMPKEGRCAIAENIESYFAYPDHDNRELTAAIAKAEGVPAESVICGNGAADIIYRLAYGIRPKKGFVFAPTFSEYETALSRAGCATERGMLDSSLVVKAAPVTDADIVFICNPNNPTGILTERSIVEDMAADCEKRGALLVADECFMDFAAERGAYSAIPLIEKYKSVIVLRAFTKMYAMAGLRLGYAITSNAAAREAIYDAGQPWSVSTVASKCGAACLLAEGFCERTRALITKNRERMKKMLEEAGVKVYDGRANYLLIHTDAADLDRRTAERGVLIRSCANYAGLGSGYFRVAVKGEADNDMLCGLISDIVSKEK